VFLIAAYARAQLNTVDAPTANPMTAEKIMLGKMLFWEEQLSTDDSIACGTCHQPESGGSDSRSVHHRHPGPDRLFGTTDDRHGSPGIVGQDQNGDYVYDELFGTAARVSINMPGSALTASHHQQLRWNGATGPEFVDPETQEVAIAIGGALEEQALHAILSSQEMAKEGRTWADVANKLASCTPMALARDLTPDIEAAINANPGYPALFAAAFGDPGITARRIAFALASYQRTLTPDQTPWDRYQAGDLSALTPDQVLGMQIFAGAGHCIECHPAPLFSDGLFHNLGIAPLDAEAGRFDETGIPEDRGAFKTPSLRNAGLRPRLFHNGASPSLMDMSSQLDDPGSVYSIYMQGGGIHNFNVDPLLQPIGSHGITENEMLATLDFVANALKDPRAEHGLPPFDHPTLRSTVAPPTTAFGRGITRSTEPELIISPAYLGNGNWKVGMVGGDAAAIGFIGWSLAGRSTPVIASGIPINIGPHILGVFFQLNDSGHDIGIGTARAPIPNDVRLQHVPLFLQLWVTDPLTTCLCATSKGYRVELDF